MLPCNKKSEHSHEQICERGINKKHSGWHYSGLLDYLVHPLPAIKELFPTLGIFLAFCSVCRNYYHFPRAETLQRDEDGAS